MTTNTTPAYIVARRCGNGRAAVLFVGGALAARRQLDVIRRETGEGLDRFVWGGGFITVDGGPPAEGSVVVADRA